VKLNNIEGPYFVSHKGVRQGDPLSPILFNFVADYLARMVRQAQSNNILCGLADNLITNGVAILQYADDTIICLKDDVDMARNMKLLLYLYELMSGLKINFGKSEIIMIHGDESKHKMYANIFNCQFGVFPIKYLGVPVSPSRLHVKDWTPLVNKNAKKLSSWKGNSLSIAGRIVLINSSLSSTFIYHMSMYLLPKTTSQSLDKQRRNFLWRGNNTRKKYHLVRWEIVCKSKKKGGLGIKDIRRMNISLLCKWWWRLDNEEGLWQNIVKAKYIKGAPIGAITHRPDDSPIWTDLLKIKYFYMKNRKVKVNNGQSTLFWEEPWMKEKPLCILHPVLYDLCLDKKISIHSVLIRGAHLNFSR